MRKLVAAALAPLAVLAARGESQSPQGTAASAAPAVAERLRTVVRVAGQPDSAFTIQERMHYWHVPGVSVAIIDDFRIVYADGFGITEFGGMTPVDTTTLFLAGSISKPVFATGALALVEQGRLSLDEDVNLKLTSWRLPDSRFTATEKVTLQRLLTHTAGLTVWGFPGYASDKPVPTVQQVLDGAPPANTSAVRNDTTPGARWLYSGGGYTIAQLLASDITGEPFSALMERLVLRPAGMARSTYENPLPGTRSGEAASGHEHVDTPVPGRFHTYPEMAAAGLWTTAPDLARWALALTRAYNGESGGLLSPAMAREMISKKADTGPRGGNGWWGLGVTVAGEGDSISFSHSGRDEGFVAQVVMWPKAGRGYVILTNGVSGALLGEVRRAFAELYGLGATPRAERRFIALDSADLAPLAGRYVATPARDTVTMDVSLRGNTLMLYTHFGKRVMQLWPESRDTFFDAHSGARYLFERDSAGGPASAIRLGAAPNAPRAVRRP